MRPISFTRSQPAADADSVAAAQLNNSAVVAINGALAVGGVATLTVPAYLTVFSEKSATVNFIVTGTAPSGAQQIETLAVSASGTVTGALSFATVTRVLSDAPTSATITIGNAIPGYTGWIPMDIYTPNQVTTISAKTSGTVNYSVEYTNEDPFDTSIVQMAVPHPNASLTAATGDETQFTTTLMRAVRLKINSGSGSVRFTVVQQSTK
jgi:hypothetical protein